MEVTHGKQNNYQFGSACDEINFTDETLKSYKYRSFRLIEDFFKLRD